MLYLLSSLSLLALALLVLVEWRDWDHSRRRARVQAVRRARVLASLEDGRS